MTLANGQILHGSYQIAALLGQGGMGAVYKALHLSLMRVCAIKENLDTSQESQMQFQREAQILAGLRHPHLPQVFEHFTEPDGKQYLVMEYVEGDDIQSMVRDRGRIAEGQAIGWMKQVLDALDYLHSRSSPVIHRDIKPSNIRVTPSGDAILVDFGIAKVWMPGQATTMGARRVTPGYSPVEQYGQAATDARSDLYAVGGTLYFMLTGVHPCEATLRFTGTQLAPPRVLNPSISPRMEQVILRAMDMARENRFQSAREMSAALDTPTAARTAAAPVVATARAVGTVVAPFGGPAPLAAAAGTAGATPVSSGWPVVSPTEETKRMGAQVPVVRQPAKVGKGRLLIPAIVGNILCILVEFGASMTPQFLSLELLDQIFLGVIAVFGLLYAAIPFAMGLWAGQRTRRAGLEVRGSGALKDGAVVGLLSSIANTATGVLYIAAGAVGAANVGPAADILSVIGLGLVVFVVFGALGDRVGSRGRG